MTAVAYLRKSRVTSDRHVSWEVQLSNVTEMAARYGDAPEVLSDWNISGRKGADQRPGYAQMLALVEAGKVDTIYSYSLSRLSRSMAEYTRLAELCRERGIRIRLVKEGEFDYSTPHGRLVVGVLALFAQMEAELASERALDTRATLVAQGRTPVTPVFADGDAVLKAYRQAGSMLGAAKLLTSWGITTLKGKTIWEPSSVRVILERVAPDELPAVRERGVKRSAPVFFYRLLVCHCGHLMTGQLDHGSVRYRCTMARTVVDHGPGSIAESRIIDWAMNEAALLELPDRDLRFATDVAEQQEALRQRKTRLGRAFTDGLFGEEEYQQELAEITAKLDELDAAGRSVRIEPISWDRAPAEVNLALRALWRSVQLDEDLRPVFADWTVPSWRREPAAAQAQTAA